MSEKSISGVMWERQQKQIPFLKSLPEKYKVHDELLDCPKCGGELFGRCLCCQQYFCHGKCIDDFPIYDEEDIAELCNGIDHDNDKETSRKTNIKLTDDIIDLFTKDQSNTN